MPHERRSSLRLSRRDALRLSGGAALAAMLPRHAFAQGEGANPAATEGMFPSPIEGVPDAYYTYPEPFTTVAEPPGRGGKVRMLFWSDKRIKSRDDNQYWQELEKRLGVEVDFTLVPGAAYADKLATTIASGDFPDIMHVFTLLSPQQSEFMIQGAYLDISPYIDGGGLQEYPNLARFPGYAWENSTLNGKRYGVPSPTSLQPNSLWHRADWREKVGLGVPANAAEYRAMLEAFTKNDPDGNGQADTYGGAFERLNAIEQRFIHGMFRCAWEGYGWRLNPDGTFTNVIETEEFRAALDYARGLWAAGVYHPDSLTQTSNEVREQIMGGTVGTGANAFILLGLIRAETAKTAPGARIDGIVPPGHNGGQGVAYNIGGYFGLMSIPTTMGKDEARVQELLRICDYYAAPFGSEERTFLNFGIEGVHHTVAEDGSRVLTQQGTEEVIGGTLGDLNTLYDPNREQVKYVQDLMAEQTRIGVGQPTVNLYSPTAAAKGAELSQLYTDRKIAIGTGREPLSALDDLIAEWKRRGGDTIRQEYEEAYQQAQG